jgi:Domain of unknown function (DUF929)
VATSSAKKKTPPRRPAPRPAARTKARGGRPAGLFTWIAVALVVVVVATLVIIKVTGGGPSSGGPQAFSPADPAVVSELTTIPDSVFNTIGVTSPSVGVSPPQTMKGTPNLSATQNGQKLPEVLYMGAEFCPYCAAERWATIIALSRFGTWSGLGNTSSYSGDIYPNTPTFTFVRAHYHSKYLVFKSVEQYANYLNAAKTYYAPLQTPTKAENKLISTWDTCKHITGLSCQNNQAIPFISFANKYMIAGSSYTPSVLDGNSRNTIAAGLSNASDPITAAIIATANYQTAAVCSITGGQPGNVCTSPGVKAAATKMGIK